MDNLPSSYYLLRWSDHITNYAELFLTLREEEEFVDCSIACEDGVVGAHRLVLAGCSPYLRDLLKRSTNPHPIIFLINVSRTTVLLLMEFIYRGQAHIPHNRLHQLVSLGKSMQIKGLSKIQLPPKYTTVLPRIPRLHGSPDAVTEFSKSLLERDSTDEENNNVEINSDVLSMEGSNYIGYVTEKSVQEKEQSSLGSAHKQDKNMQASDKSNFEIPTDSEKQSTSNKENNNIQNQENRESLENSPQKKVIQSNINEPKVPPPKRNLDAESTRYVPKPKCKKMDEMKETQRQRTPSPLKVKKVIKVKTNTQGKKEKLEMPARQDTKKNKKPNVGKRENNVKVKPPVFKVKKTKAPLKKVVYEPKSKLYNGGDKLKLKLGNYALRYGIPASEKYVLAKYGVKMRRISIQNMMKFATAYNKKNSQLKKGSSKK